MNRRHVLTLCVGALAGCAAESTPSTDTATRTPRQTETETPTPTSTATPDPPATFGEWLGGPDVETTALRVEARPSVDEGTQQGAELHVAARNTTESVVEGPSWDDFLLTSESQQWSPLNIASFDAAEILPGSRTEGWIAFRVPGGLSLAELGAAYTAGDKVLQWEPK
jgi:hypothetical protein